MEKTKHTPGEWEAEKIPRYTAYWNIKVPRIEEITPIIAKVGGSILIGREETEANARLIAAAPELLEQLKSAREMIACAMEKDDPLWFTQQEAALLDPIDDAIAKAEGQEE